MLAQHAITIALLWLVLVVSRQSQLSSNFQVGCFFFSFCHRRRRHLFDYLQSLYCSISVLFYGFFVSCYSMPLEIDDSYGKSNWLADDGNVIGVVMLSIQRRTISSSVYSRTHTQICFSISNIHIRSLDNKTIDILCIRSFK